MKNLFRSAAFVAAATAATIAPAQSRDFSQGGTVSGTREQILEICKKQPDLIHLFGDEKAKKILAEYQASLETKQNKTTDPKKDDANEAQIQKLTQEVSNLKKKIVTLQQEVENHTSHHVRDVVSGVALCVTFILGYAAGKWREKKKKIASEKAASEQSQQDHEKRIEELENHVRELEQKITELQKNQTRPSTPIPGTGDDLMTELPEVDDAVLPEHETIDGVRKIPKASEEAPFETTEPTDFFGGFSGFGFEDLAPEESIVEKMRRELPPLTPGSILIGDNETNTLAESISVLDSHLATITTASYRGPDKTSGIRNDNIDRIGVQMSENGFQAGVVDGAGGSQGTEGLAHMIAHCIAHTNFDTTTPLSPEQVESQIAISPYAHKVSGYAAADYIHAIPSSTGGILVSGWHMGDTQAYIVLPDGSSMKRLETTDSLAYDLENNPSNDQIKKHWIQAFRSKDDAQNNPLTPVCFKSFHAPKGSRILLLSDGICDLHGKKTNLTVDDLECITKQYNQKGGLLSADECIRRISDIITKKPPGERKTDNTSIVIIDIK